MKRCLVLLLTGLLALPLAACGGAGDSAGTESSGDQNVPEAGDSAGTEPSGDQNVPESALALLEEVWSSYEEADRFPAAGGDMSEENMVMDAPGKYGINDTAALDATLGFPAASAGKIDDAASLVHMMNANTFICGVFHVKSGDDSADVSAAIKDNIMQRQWMCGFPDKLVIMQVDRYIISFFGEAGIVDTFRKKLSAVYTSAELVCDEPLA